VVARAYEDPQWGGVVELNAGKLTVRVCGLADIAVKEGDTVAVGDALGTVGELPAESAMETHVHLEFLEDGAYVDPAEYFAPVE
jgi:putative M23 peptidase domain protein